MKMKGKLVLVLGVLLVFVMVFMACENGTNGGGNGGNGKNLTIKNSTSDLTIIGIHLEDAMADDTNIGVIVGTDDDSSDDKWYEAVSIKPGETYTSPEIKCQYVNWYALTTLEHRTFYHGAAERGDTWEIYKYQKSTGEWEYSQREVTGK
jgi:hypothetical protein